MRFDEQPKKACGKPRLSRVVLGAEDLYVFITQPDPWVMDRSTWWGGEAAPLIVGDQLQKQRGGIMFEKFTYIISSRYRRFSFGRHILSLADRTAHFAFAGAGECGCARQSGSQFQVRAGCFAGYLQNGEGDRWRDTKHAYAEKNNEYKRQVYKGCRQQKLPPSGGRSRGATDRIADSFAALYPYRTFFCVPEKPACHQYLSDCCGADKQGYVLAA
jgi:hypothetical protein